MQYMLLRELVVNDLAENIPEYCIEKYCIKHLAHGGLKKHNFYNIYPFT